MAKKRVMISYSHKDINSVVVIENSLIAAGIEVWRDKKLEVGDEWLRKILKEIQASHYVILMLSPDSVSSEYVGLETMYANLKAQLEAREKFILPVLVKPCDALPEWIARLQYIDFTKDQAAASKKLIDAILGSKKRRWSRSVAIAIILIIIFFLGSFLISTVEGFISGANIALTSVSNRSAPVIISSGDIQNGTYPQPRQCVVTGFKARSDMPAVATLFANPFPDQTTAAVLFEGTQLIVSGIVQSILVSEYEVTEYNMPVIISEIIPNTPAERVGLQPFDTVIGIDDQSIETPDEFIQYVQNHAGKPMTIRIKRETTTLSFSVTPIDSGGKAIIGVSLMGGDSKTHGYIPAMLVSCSLKNPVAPEMAETAAETSIP